MDLQPPPFFRQGPSALARLIFFAGLSITLIVVDARMHTLEALRVAVGTTLYPLQRGALWPTEVARTVIGHFEEVATLRSQNEQLRLQRLADATQLLQMEELSAENTRLRALVDARARAGIATLMVEALYDTRDPFAPRVVIDRGSQAGVKVAEPVIDESGLVGQVVRTFPFTSEIALATDRDQTTPVQLRRTGLRTLAQGGEEPGTIELRFLAANADVQEGDQLVTSGLDGVYPAGLPVAKVRTVDRTADPTFARIIADPIARIRGASMLLVLRVEAQLPEGSDPNAAAVLPPSAKSAPADAGKPAEAPREAAKEAAKEAAMAPGKGVPEVRSAGGKDAARAAPRPASPAPAAVSPAPAGARP
ncbi:rod shape-determining protein MreC [Derxia gummosa]|uniref:Cell shape-determining protein MreC n=1 Tax=Derxia gummosa DSM 723 TaxID=1121388 RepID=A0A8B6X2Y1_9BURK|nr:rod shape-determining protein MreC [Derxia gummosa]